MNGDAKFSTDSTAFSEDPAASAPESTQRCNVGDSARTSDVQQVVSFNAISGGTNEVVIEHEGHKYRLRATRNGRLLLNK